MKIDKNEEIDLKTLLKVTIDLIYIVGVKEALLFFQTEKKKLKECKNEL